MDLTGSRSFTGDEVKQMLTGVYEVLAKAEKYAKDKEKEAEEATVRSRALEKVILYGDFQEGSIPPPPPSPPKNISNVFASPSQNRNGSDDSVITQSAHNLTESAIPNRLHYSRNTNAARVLKSAIKETATRERMKYEEEIEMYKVENELFKHQIEALRKELDETKLERDSHQKALITAVEETRAEVELKCKRELDLAVRAESSRVKQWAEDRVARKERILTKKYQKNMDKKELEGYEKAMKKFGKRSHYQIAHDAVLDEKANQIANKKIVTIQKTADARIKVIQEELTQAKNALKTVKSERDQARAELRVSRRSLKQHLEKLKAQMELAHGQKIKEKERTHRQELQKHVRKVIHVSRMMKLQTSNKINGANTKSNSKNTQARVKAVTSERKIVKIDSDQKMLGTTASLQNEDVYSDNFDDKVKSSEQPPPLAVAVAVRDEENTMNSPRGAEVLDMASPTPNTPTGFEDFE